MDFAYIAYIMSCYVQEYLDYSSNCREKVARCNHTATYCARTVHVHVPHFLLGPYTYVYMYVVSAGAELPAGSPMCTAADGDSRRAATSHAG